MDELVFKSKVEDGNITIERKSHLSERTLKYMRELCSGCGLCAVVCPEDCITLNPPSAKNVHPVIVIDPDKCLLCGICSEACLFNALEVTANGKPVKEFEGTPYFSLIYEIDESKCPPDCKDCELACPRNALKCDNGVQRDEKLCIYCKNCAIACPENTIIVEKVFSGEIVIEQEKCQTCGVCYEVCHPKAIAFPKFELGREPERITVNEEICIYCGACEKACPLDVIKVVRKNVSYSITGVNPWTKKHEEAFKKIVSG